MARETCDGCGKPVRIAGSTENLWTTRGEESGGIDLEFEDGAERFCCTACLDRLPADPAAADVDAIAADESVDDWRTERETVETTYFPAALVGFGIGGALVGLAAGSTTVGFSVGVAVGAVVGLAADRLR